MSRDARIQVLMDKEEQLQAIANEPRCEHGNVYTHVILVDIRTTKWCDGAPKLAALLDALRAGANDA